MISFPAKYTVVLLEVLKDPIANNRIVDALSHYPIYEGKKDYDLIPTREQLNTKILNHYKYREIGFETVGRFIDELKITMDEIMPYYNELFKTVEIMADIEDPFGNVDMTETYSEERTDSSSGENASNVSATSNSEQNTESNSTVNDSKERERRFQDTPQNNVTDIDRYLTDYTKENETNNSQGTSNSSTTDSTQGSTSTTSNGSSESSGTTSHTLHRKGNHGVNTYAHDMNEFRTSIIDIVDRIIHDKRLAELFMLVW